MTRLISVASGWATQEPNGRVAEFARIQLLAMYG